MLDHILIRWNTGHRQYAYRLSQEGCVRPVLDGFDNGDLNSTIKSSGSTLGYTIVNLYPTKSKKLSFAPTTLGGTRTSGWAWLRCIGISKNISYIKTVFGPLTTPQSKLALFGGSDLNNGAYVNYYVKNALPSEPPNLGGKGVRKTYIRMTVPLKRSSCQLQQQQQVRQSPYTLQIIRCSLHHPSIMFQVNEPRR